jgi:hypothetical protein
LTIRPEIGAVCLSDFIPTKRIGPGAPPVDPPLADSLILRPVLTLIASIMPGSYALPRSH